MFDNTALDQSHIYHAAEINDAIGSVHAHGTQYRASGEQVAQNGTVVLQAVPKIEAKDRKVGAYGELKQTHDIVNNAHRNKILLAHTSRRSNIGALKSSMTNARTAVKNATSQNDAAPSVIVVKLSATPPYARRTPNQAAQHNARTSVQNNTTAKKNDAPPPVMVVQAPSNLKAFVKRHNDLCGGMGGFPMLNAVG